MSEVLISQSHHHSVLITQNGCRKKNIFKFKVTIFFLKYSTPDSLNLLVTWWFYDGVALLSNTDENNKDRMMVFDFMTVE